MRCSICQKPIHNPETLASGIGEICLSKLRFAEKLGSKELNLLMNKKEKLSDACKPKRSLILKNKNNENIFVTILSSNSYGGKILNRTKLQNYLKNRLMFGIAYLRSIEKVSWDDYLYASEINNPKDKEMSSLFRKFKKKYKEEIKEEESSIKNKAYRGFLPYYRVVRREDDLSSDQKFNRDQLFGKDLKKDEFWKNYYYHYSTIQERLSKCKNKEAQLLLKSIKKEGVKPKDYGLTDVEIIESLKFNKKEPFDHFLINTFLLKNPNINHIINIFNSLESLNNFERIRKINLMKQLANEKLLMPEEELERLKK